MRLIDADKLEAELRKTKFLDANDKVIVCAVIENAQTIDAVPVKHGRWIDGHCSNCGCDVPAYIIDWKWQKDMDANFCPNCGAKMDEKRKNAEKTD